MNKLPETPTLKDINAYKKKVTWGDVPAIYHMTHGSISELDGILSHGFDSAYKRLLNKNHWNLDLLQGFQDDNGDIQVKQKPKISLKHYFDEQNYEIHCYPIVRGEELDIGLLKHPLCPFENWVPESMKMLFRINNIASFILFAYKSGDAADLALIKYAHNLVDKLINILSESFEIIDISGYSIAEFCMEINRRTNLNEMLDSTLNLNGNTE